MVGDLVDVGYAELPSPLGPLWIAFAGATLLILDFADNTARVARLAAKRFPRRGLTSKPLPPSLRAPLEAYFDGAGEALRDLPCQTGGSAFQRQVWQALRAVPTGATRSYGELAVAVGRTPAASRAVGAAVGANPISIVIPCHRIVGADGRLTGYAGGLERKRWLLGHEGVRL